MTEIRKVRVPQPDLIKFEVDGKLFPTEEDAQHYLNRSKLTPVYLVYYKRRPETVEVFSSKELAMASLKFVKNEDKGWYVVDTLYVDEFLR